MKIAFDAKRYYHNSTGLGNYSRSLIQGLQAYASSQVECVLYDAKSWERTFWLGKHAELEKCRLYHGLSNELPFDILKTSLPSIVTMHDVAWRTYPGMYHFIDRQLYDLKYGWAAKHATRVLCISESTKRDVQKFYQVPEDRTTVIYQPVASHFYTPIAKVKAWELIRDAEERHLFSKALPRQGFLLNVGSINSRKNLLGLVKALELIPKDQRPLLLVIGRGREYQKEVENYLISKNLTSYVQIESNISDNQLLQALYTIALALAYPSHYEGMGLPVIEAELQACPVLTSNVSSLPETTGPDGLLVDPSSVDSIHAGLSQLLDDNIFYQKLRIQGEAYARKMFSPEALTVQLVHLYQDLLVH